MAEEGANISDIMDTTGIMDITAIGGTMGDTGGDHR
jgi:hypothetical protein